ncbi:hypothetical protein M378DRAFT_168245, partial [Amanita muscaria Koide BX008]
MPTSLVPMSGCFELCDLTFFRAFGDSLNGNMCTTHEQWQILDLASRTTTTTENRWVFRQEL